MFWRLEENISGMSQSYHGCAKIKGQPIPFSYNQLIALITHVYCFTVPVIFVNSYEWAVGVPAFLIALVFFGVDELGHEVSEPFGDGLNCLDS